MRILHSVVNFLLRFTHNGQVTTHKCYKSRYTKKEKKILSNVIRAEEYYEKVYLPIYGEKWKKIKKALINDAKYGAVLNNFSDTAEILETFESLGAYDVGKFYTKNAKVFDLGDANETETITPEHQEKSNVIRPSMMELTEEEIADKMENIDIHHYPEEYKKRAVAKGVGFSDFDFDPSRIIKAAEIGDKPTLNFGHIPSTRLKGLENFIEEADVFHGLKNTDEDTHTRIITEKEPIRWPENLQFYSFVKGEITEFPSPLPSKTIPSSTHYLLNGASILPVLALDIQRGENIMDLCASPGGKSLAILQTLMPNILVCNDISISRTNRIKSVMDQFIPEELVKLRNKITILSKVKDADYPDTFDKVLIDAPCLNDRLSITEPDNNIFKPTRIKERLQLPYTQADLIIAGLKMTKPGGCVVYSTCTLSPLQNDGAVHLALNKIWRETKINCSVVNMVQTVKNLSFMYAFGYNLNLRYGHIVLPFPDNNCGPMYVAKIVRER